MVVDRLLKDHEAGQLVGLSAETWRKLRAKGAVRSVRIGKRAVRTPESEVARFLRNLRKARHPSARQ
jgi:predicted DNA-binding transcriptional regulator AlpA